MTAVKDNIINAKAIATSKVLNPVAVLSNFDLRKFKTNPVIKNIILFKVVKTATG
jgi:hypothetical protein